MDQHVSFQQVDVFTNQPYKGNPVAVIMAGDDLTTAQMQQIANWCNLSETTFICSPTTQQADYRLRIFSPQHELPFAGHPTIGSARAILNQGLIPKNKGYLIQECQQGLVKIYIENNKLFLTLPQPKKRKIMAPLLAQVAAKLGISTSDIQLNEMIDVGAVWLTLQLQDANQVLALQPDYNELGKILPAGVTGVTVFGTTSKTSATDFEVRSFVPNEGVSEDPVCGSGNGCVAVMVRDYGLISQDSYIASQGSQVGREGYVTVYLSSDKGILVGGEALTCIQGKILKP